MKDLKLKIIAEGFDKASKPFRNIIKTSGSLQQSLGKTAKDLKDLNATQKRMTGFGKLKRASKSTSIELGKAQKEAQQLAQAFRKADNPTRKMAQAQKKAALEVKKLKQQQIAQRQELQSSRSVLASAGVNVRKLGTEQSKVARKIADTNRRLDQQGRALRRATALQNRMTQASARSRRTLQTQSNVSFVGAAGAAGGGLALRGISQTLTPGLGFDEQMSAVGGIARLDKTSEGFAALRAQALELGATTHFAASEAAGGMEFLAMAGFDASEIMSTMPGMLDLAKAGRTELAETADIASNILTTFDMDPARMGEVGDTLVATFTRSNVDLRKLGETMKYVGPIANEAGAGLQEAAAMAGLLGNAGIQASDSGTAMRSIYTRLAAPPSEAAKALDRLNISTTDAAGNLREVPSILAEVAAKTENLGSAERLGFFTDIAGLRAGGAFAKLVGEGGAGAITQFIEVLNLAEGEAHALALAMGDNAAGDLKGLTSAWEGLNIAISDTQTSPLRALVQGVTAIVRGATAWVRENPRLASGIFTVVTGLAALWAVVGGLALAVAGIIGPFAMVSFALTAVGLKGLALVPVISKIGAALALVGKMFLANPIGLAITAIALAAFLIWKYWEPLGGSFTAVLGTISAAIVNWSPLGLFYRAFAGVLSWFGVDLPATFTGFGEAIVMGLIDGITGTWGWLTETVSGIGDLISGTFKSVMGIQSPSRVFAQMGGFVTEGLAQGIQGGQARAVTAVSTVARALPRAMAVGAVGASLATVPAYAGQSAQAVVGGDRIEFHIHAAPGMDEHALAAQVRQQLEARDREMAARRRSTLHD